jgi:hypothetical protein
MLFFTVIQDSAFQKREFLREISRFFIEYHSKICPKRGAQKPDGWPQSELKAAALQAVGFFDHFL